jgi:hypothetical protein
MKKIIQKTRWLAAVALLVSVQAQAVPVQWAGNGHWYDIVPSGANGAWANAEANAVGLGGHLVTINDLAEETWLRATFGSSTRFWIGYTDAATEGTWLWSSGETPGFTHWDGGEPNNVSPPPVGEDYAVLNWNTGDGAWNDWDHLRPDYYYINGIAEWPAGVPEAGSSAVLLGLSGVLLITLQRRCR